MSKPTPRDCREYALSFGYSLNGEAFWNDCELKDWKNNEGEPVDWKAKVRVWAIKSKSSEDFKYQELPKEPENERKERCIRRSLCPSCYSRLTTEWDDKQLRCEGCLKEY